MSLHRLRRFLLLVGDFRLLKLKRVLTSAYSSLVALMAELVILLYNEILVQDRAWL